MAYVKPQAIIHQEFTVTSSPTVETLRAVIVGPNAKLHRHAVADEREEIFIGNYGNIGDAELALDDMLPVGFPAKAAGSLIDDSSTKLCIDNALLAYYTDDTVTGATVETGWDPKFYADSDEFNVLSAGKNDTGDLQFNFVPGLASTDSITNPGRDVEEGDFVWIQGTSRTNDDNCALTEPFLSKIIGLTYVTDDPSISKVADNISGRTTIEADSDYDAATIVVNEAHGTAAAATSTLIAAKSGSGYAFNGWALGKKQVTYDIYPEVYTSSNCGDTIRLHIRCEELGVDYYDFLKNTDTTTSGFPVHSDDVALQLSGTETSNLNTSTDNVVSLYLAGTTTYAAILNALKGDRDGISGADPLGYRRWEVVCACAAIDAEISTEDPSATVGTDSITFKAQCTTGGHNFKVDDVVILTCTHGATIDSSVSTSDEASFMVSTSYGRIIDPDLRITKAKLKTGSTNGTITIGATGLVLTVVRDKVTLFTGDTFYIYVDAPEIIACDGLQLADDIPGTLRNTDNTTKMGLNIALISVKDIEVAPNTYFVQEDTQVLISQNFQYSDSTGSYSLASFPDDADLNKMYVEYREWVVSAASSMTLCETVSALDLIPGPLDPDNPLKYGVYKALANSNGASVGYVAVANPDNLDSWQDALSIIEGRDDVYTVVPLTTDQKVQNLAATLIENESAAEACHWKTAIFSMTVPDSKMIVGLNSTDNTINETSTDGRVVYAVFRDNSSASGTQYTKLSITSGNAKFIDYGVLPGDTVKVCSNGVTAATYVVDNVLSNGTLLLTSGPSIVNTEDAVGSPIEVWHQNTKADKVAVIQAYAQSFADRRIGLSWPDTVGEAGVELPGYYVSCALAGLKSGVKPIQGLTRVEVAGFDDYSRSKPYFTESQLNLLAGSGVWIVLGDSDGTPMSRHAINTSTVDINYREEMMTRNMDSICKYLFQIIDRYIGVTIVNQETLSNVNAALTKACDYLITKQQMNSYESITVKQHDLLADRIEARIIASLPYATNNVELYVTAERSDLDEVVTGSSK